MATNVKQESGGAGVGRTRVSSKHQVTIPRAAFETAGLRTGDTLRVEAAGTGRVTLTRLDALLERYRGALPAQTISNADIEQMREQWR